MHKIPKKCGSGRGVFMLFCHFETAVRDATHSRTSKRIPSFAEEGEANLSDLMVKMLVLMVNALLASACIQLNHSSHREETWKGSPEIPSWPAKKTRTHFFTAKVCLSCSQLHSAGRKRVSEKFVVNFSQRGLTVGNRFSYADWC